VAEVREVEEGVTFPLGHQGDCHFLQRTLGGHFSRDHSGFRVQRRVGQVRLPSGTILRVRSPKALQANLLAWIVYAHPQLRSLATLPQAAAEGELAPWLARVFLEELQRALGTSGLLRQYRPQTAGESSIRGRIDFARLAHSQSNPARVPCRTFHRRDDTPLNRLFAAALQVIARHPELRTGGSATFRALQLCFDGITPAVPDRAIVIERLQQPFHLSHDLARLLVGRRGLGDGLELPGLAYLVDLEALFEKAVVRAFQEHVPGVRVKHNLIRAGASWTPNTSKASAARTCSRW
jgi:5-methylcytosine-specific restriction endonuclease McrBC regulatory subunit McrC